MFRLSLIGGIFKNKLKLGCNAVTNGKILNGLIESFYYHKLLVLLTNCGRMISPAIRLQILQSCLNVLKEIKKCIKTDREKAVFKSLCDEVQELKPSEEARKYIDNPEVCGKIDETIDVFYKTIKNTCIMQKTMSK